MTSHIGALLIAAVALVFAPFGARAAEPVVLGAMYNLTGGQQDLDNPSSRGAKLAVEEANQKGGVLGRPIKLILVDWCSLRRASPCNTSMSSSPRVRPRRNCRGRCRAICSSLASETMCRPLPAPSLLNTLKAHTAVVLYRQTSTYAKLLHGYFETRFKQLGGKVLTVRGYTLATIKAKVKDLPKADLVYFAAQPDDVLPGIAALRAAGVAEPILGGDGLNIGAAWKQAAEVDKIYFTAHAYLGSDNADTRVQAFRAAFAKAYPGQQADAFSALGYDTARLMMAAIKSAGGTEPQAVRKALAAACGFQGVIGTIGYRHGNRIPAKSLSIIAVGQGRQTFFRHRAAAGNPSALIAGRCCACEWLSAKRSSMLRLADLKREWHHLSLYERFEQVVTRILMLFISVVIVDSLVLVAIELFNDFQLGMAFAERELLQDIFGSVLTILILLEFNHSIALALTKKSGVIQARVVVLIAVLVVARKIILLDFKTVPLESMLGIGGMALALGVLYWLLGVEHTRARE